MARGLAGHHWCPSQAEILGVLRFGGDGLPEVVDGTVPVGGLCQEVSVCHTSGYLRGTTKDDILVGVIAVAAGTMSFAGYTAYTDVQYYVLS